MGETICKFEVPFGRSCIPADLPVHRHLFTLNCEQYGMPDITRYGIIADSKFLANSSFDVKAHGTGR
ncbi:hypothetical protein Poly24_25660 [Rosistilla carotiformis]|uniref:Uncharacterized protein n=1 Tax=Rosistilla carotiformis TaxID=2528017 RepID=A0A518JTI8_9BACT|nr:hypothetical protein Poly24_25660 [Rosistilla carotiformis]